MLPLTPLEKALFFIAFLLLIFGLTELGILAHLGRPNYLVPPETKTPSGVAITVAGAVAIVDGILCMLYAGILTQKVWVNPTPSDPQAHKDLHRFTIITALFSYLFGAAILILFVFVFVAEQGWISGNDAALLTICTGAFESCRAIKAQRWLLIPMWLLGLTLAGLTTVNALIRSRNQTPVAEDKQARNDSESQDSESGSSE